MMKKKILLGLLVFSLFIVSCAPIDEGSESLNSDLVIKTAFMYWPGMYWIEIADKKGWFEEAGLNLELANDANVNFASSEKAIADGEINTGLVPLFDLMNFRAANKNLVAIILADVSNGADQIVSRKEIENIQNLKGRKVGVPEESFLEFMLEKALEKNRLTNDDIIIINVQAENINELEKGTVDAMLTWEPFASKLKEKINGKTIFDSSDIPGLIPDTIVFNKEFIENNPKEVQAFVNVWHKTTKFMKTNPEEAFQIIAEIYDVPVSEVQAFTQGVKILDLNDNKIAFSYAAGFESLHGTAKQINQFMIDKGITDKLLDSTQFIDARFIRGVQE
jgi:NitT/TauT family transport system substrate-binding protein